MPDFYTSHLRLIDQTEGGNNNTWGSIVDDNWYKVDKKAGEITAISTTGGSTTLSETQERVNAIHVSGALVSDATINFSGRGGTWIVKNATTGSRTVTCKVTGQTGVAIEQGGVTVVYCNGTDIAYANPPSAAAAEVTIASAATTNILGAASEFVLVTGTSTISSFGTGASKKRFVRVNNILTITHNATSLVCPGGYSIKTAAGDSFQVVSDASSNARIVQYQRGQVPPPTLPVGSITDYVGSFIPAGWVGCFGQAVSRTTYAGLFAVIGVTFGVGDGSTTFNVPDLSGRTTAGMFGQTAGRLTSAVSGINGDTLGASGGAQSFTIAQANLPAVNLSAASLAASTTSTSSQIGTNGTTGGNWATGGASRTVQSLVAGAGGLDTVTPTITSTTTLSGVVPLGGSGTALANVQPTMVVYKMIYAGV